MLIYLGGPVDTDEPMGPWVGLWALKGHDKTV